MSTTSHRHRQRLLTRSDLIELSVAEDRILTWLGNGELVCVGELTDEAATDEVYAATADSLGDQLQLLLQQHGRNEVVLDLETVRTLLADQESDRREHGDSSSNEPSSETTAEDVIAEHGAEEALDVTIENISSAIENLIETSDHLPADLRDDASENAPLVLTDNLDEGTDIVEQATHAAPLEVIPTEPTPLVRPAVDTHRAAPVRIAASAAQDLPQTMASVRGAMPPSVPSLTIDLQPLLESMQQIHLALLTLGERPQPQFDATPIVSALDHGIRSLNQHIAAAGDRTTVSEGLGQLHSAIVAGNAALAESILTLGQRMEAAVHAMLSRSPVAIAARSFDATSGIAAATIAAGWASSMWLYGSDTRLALSVLVCANLVGCCALLLRRR